MLEAYGRFVRSKRPGAALLAIVLVGLIVLSIVSAVAINISWHTVRQEAWATQGMDNRRLDMLARSAANAVAEDVRSNDLPTGANVNNSENGISSVPTPIFSNDEKTDTYLTVKLVGTNSLDFTITSTASDDRAKAVVSLTCVSSDGKLTKKWSGGK